MPSRSISGKHPLPAFGVGLALAHQRLSGWDTQSAHLGGSCSVSSWSGSQGRDLKLCLWDLAEGRNAVTDSVHLESMGFCRSSILTRGQGHWMLAMPGSGSDEVSTSPHGAPGFTSCWHFVPLNTHAYPKHLLQECCVYHRTPQRGGSRSVCWIAAPGALAWPPVRCPVVRVRKGGPSTQYQWQNGQVSGERLPRQVLRGLRRSRTWEGRPGQASRRW